MKGGTKYDKKWYRETIWNCCIFIWQQAKLMHDLEKKYFLSLKGHGHDIGENYFSKLNEYNASVLRHFQ